jgi:hypothetical protein
VSAPAAPGARLRLAAGLVENETLKLLRRRRPQLVLAVCGATGVATFRRASNPHARGRTTIVPDPAVGMPDSAWCNGGGQAAFARGGG